MKGKYLTVLIALCGIASAAVGICMNTAGLFYKPIAADLGVGIGSVSLTMTILTIASSFTALFVPKVLKEGLLKWIIITSAVLMGGGTFLMAMAKTPWALYIASIIRGLGSGMGSFVLVTSILNNWYYKQHGLITSIALSFSGIPGVILSPIITALINGSGWRIAMVVVGVLIILLTLPAVFLNLTIRPQTQGMVPYGYEEFLAEKEKGNIRVVAGGDNDFSYRTREFRLAVLFVIAVMLVASLPNYLPAYAEASGLASISGIILSMTLAGNIVSKVFFGVIADKLSAKVSIVLFAFICILSIIPLYLHNSTLLVLIAALTYNFTAANSSVGVSILTSDLFGEGNYSKAYPMLSFIGSYALAFSSAAIGFIYDLAGSYNIIFIAILLIQAFVIAVTILSYRSAAERKREAQQNI